MNRSGCDYTIFFRELSGVKVTSTVTEAITVLQSCLYDEAVLVGDHRLLSLWEDWMASYIHRIKVNFHLLTIQYYSHATCSCFFNFIISLSLLF